MDHERRVSGRHRVGVFFNAYIDGIPHLWEALEISESGALVRRLTGPNDERASYALELGAAEKESPFWLCAAPVWRRGPIEALRFIGRSIGDTSRLQGFIGQVAA